MGRWHCCCVGVWSGCDCGVFCIVGMTGVIGCWGQFSCFAQVVLEMPLCHFCGTFKCVAVQFSSGAFVAHCIDCCKAQLCIVALILTLFLLFLISKHLGMSI
jgi:hypothetical protein